MEKVYLLSQDNPPDHHIIGVFSSREVAERVRAEYYGSDIVEWTLDELAGRRTGPVWEVEINKIDGGITHPRTWEVFRDPEAVNVIDMEDRIQVTSPVSHGHAVGVAVARREEWLAANDPAALALRLGRMEYERLRLRENVRRQEWAAHMARLAGVAGPECRDPNPEPPDNWMDGYRCPPRPEGLTDDVLDRVPL